MPAGIAPRALGGLGVDGGARTWRVTGAWEPIVRVRFNFAQGARVCGVPVKVETLDLSPEDPDGFMAAVARS